MEQLKRLAIPEPIEIAVLFILSITLLLVENIKRFWLMLQGDTAIVVKQTGASENALGNYIRGVQQFISPKLVDFLLWALIGCFVFVAASLIIAFIKTLGSESELLHYYRSPTSRAHEVNGFLTKIALRGIGALSLLLWFGYFAKVVNPYLVKLFFDSITSLNNPASWLWILISIVLYAFSVYFFVLLIRLIALKTRIFGTVAE